MSGPRDRLLDEQSDPTVRATLGAYLARARSADFALARLRLAGIDLTPLELRGVSRCRVLLGRLDAETFGEAAEVAAREPKLRENLQVLSDFLASGRVQARVARSESWSPDFAVLSGVGGPGRSVAIVGVYHLAESYPQPGPRFACFFHDRRAAARMKARFEELWRRGYDVNEVIGLALGRVLRDSR